MRGKFWCAIAATLLLVATPAAWGCSLCLSAFELQLNTQLLVHAEQAVLAVPEGLQRYKVVAVVKHGPAVGEMIDGKVTRLGVPPAAEVSAPRLLLREEGWLVWADLGSVDLQHAGWLRRVAAFSRNADLTESQRAQYVAFFLPALASPDPMVRTMAAAEIASAPYGALRVNRANVDRALVLDRLAAPAYAKQRALYWLLLGFAGNARDGARVDQEVERAWRAHDAADLGAKLAALVELRGSEGVAKVERLYLRDARRSQEERDAAEHALEEAAGRPSHDARTPPARPATQPQTARRIEP